MSPYPVHLSTDARGVATITLDRPDVNNAYNGAMLEGLLGCATDALNDPAVRVIVIRGAGRHFQAGADLRWLDEIRQRDAEANLAASRLTAQALRALNEAPKPTVALVQGACVGGGTGLVASCDVVIAERSARFAISEAKWGVAATVIFPQLDAAIGLRQVRRYALSCESFDAERAREIGLVHEVCEPGGLDAAAAPILDGLLRAAPGSVALSKLSAMRCAHALIDDALFERLVREHADKRQSDEAREGLASFARRRSPAWAR